MFFFGPRTGKRAKLVAVLVIFSKCAKFKKMPDAVMLELELCASGDVPGKETKHELFSRLQFPEQFEHAGKQIAFAARQLEREKMHVAVEKRGHVFVGCQDFVLPQNAENDSGIGHAGDLDVVQIVVNSVALGQRELERVHARAARMHQCAVNIEEKKALCDCQLWIVDFGLSLHLCNA